MAIGLASDRPALDEIKQRLRRNRLVAPLFDTAGRVRELEAVFERILKSPPTS
jgi:predicted O-linked N-acetylglucosamine transferase (SPINDLY family)